MTVVAFVPMKSDNARLPNKHFLPLAGSPLYTHVFRALTGVRGLDRICAWTSDDRFREGLPEGVEFVRRDRRFDGGAVRGLDLFRGFAADAPADHYLLAHATAPFLRTGSMQTGLDAVLSGEFDSAFSSLRIQTYCRYRGAAVNYDPEDMARTQDIEPVHVETSGFYIYGADELARRSRRIGDRPLAVEVSVAEAIDIDWPEDYDTACRFADLLDGR